MSTDQINLIVLIGHKSLLGRNQIQCLIKSHLAFFWYSFLYHRKEKLLENLLQKRFLRLFHNINWS